MSGWLWIKHITNFFQMQKYILPPWHCIQFIRKDKWRWQPNYLRNLIAAVTSHSKRFMRFCAAFALHESQISCITSRKHVCKRKRNGSITRTYSPAVPGPRSSVNYSFYYSLHYKRNCDRRITPRESTNDSCELSGGRDRQLMMATERWRSYSSAINRRDEMGYQ